MCDIRPQKKEGEFGRGIGSSLALLTVNDYIATHSLERLWGIHHQVRGSLRNKVDQT